MTDGMPPRPLTSVVIPTWNALDLTRACLEQLLASTTQPYELIVVDNGSKDGTPSWLRTFRRRALRQNPRRALRRVELLFNPVNRGYPSAVNRGLRAARGELLVLGNSDAAAGPFWLEGMHGALRGRPRIGGLAPTSNPLRRLGAPLRWAWPPYYDDLRGLNRFAGSLALRANVKDFRPARGYLPGFWFMTRRSVLDAVGLLDEAFSPGGYEDLDLQLRIRRAGYIMGFAARSFVHHLWFGCCTKNGLKVGDLFNRRLLGIFSSRHPGAMRKRFAYCLAVWARNPKDNCYSPAIHSRLKRAAAGATRT